MSASGIEKIETSEISSLARAAGSMKIGCSAHQLKSRDKFSAVEEIVSNCPVFGFLDEAGKRETFIQEVFHRESLGSTGIGHNVAIPHGKCSLMDRVRVGLGISREGIEFGSIDGELVHLVLVIGSSPSNQVEYLKSLAFIMNHLKNPFLRSALINIPLFSGKMLKGPHSHFLQILQSQTFS